MILEVTYLDVHAGFQREFEQTLPEALKMITTAPGYLGHTVKRSIENRCRYMLLVQWERKADSDENFRGTMRHQKLKQMIHRFYEMYPATEYYETVGGFAEFGTGQG